jgi:hypothetical protein
VTPAGPVPVGLVTQGLAPKSGPAGSSAADAVEAVDAGVEFVVTAVVEALPVDEAAPEVVAPIPVASALAAANTAEKLAPDELPDCEVVWDAVVAVLPLLGAGVRVACVGCVAWPGVRST